MENRLRHTRLTKASSTVHTPQIIIRMEISRISPRSSLDTDRASSGPV